MQCILHVLVVDVIMHPAVSDITALMTGLEQVSNRTAEENSNIAAKKCLCFHLKQMWTLALCNEELKLSILCL